MFKGTEYFWNNWADTSLTDSKFSKIQNGFFSLHFNKGHFSGCEVMELKQSGDAGDGMFLL